MPSALFLFCVFGASILQVRNNSGQGYSSTFLRFSNPAAAGLSGQAAPLKLTSKNSALMTGKRGHRRYLQSQ
jgi:hypothetical protein